MVEFMESAIKGLPGFFFPFSYCLSLSAGGDIARTTRLCSTNQNSDNKGDDIRDQRPQAKFPQDEERDDRTNEGCGDLSHRVLNRFFATIQKSECNERGNDINNAKLIVAHES